MAPPPTSSAGSAVKAASNSNSNSVEPGSDLDGDAFWKWQNEVYAREVGDNEEALMWRPEADGPTLPADPTPLPTNGPAAWSTATGENFFEMLVRAVDEYDTRQAGAAAGAPAEGKKDDKKDTGKDRDPGAAGTGRKGKGEEKGKQGG